MRPTQRASGRSFSPCAFRSARSPRLDEALAHIARYSSQHSETIIAEDAEAIRTFQREVDAACVYANVSTAFTDGAQFGMGAEIGISTQKLHARGRWRCAN